MPSRIALLSTGGTIAGLPAKGVHYQAGVLPPERLLDAVPQVSEWARISVEAHADVGSQDVGHELWASLARRVRDLSSDVDAVVITHGTDTMEETAFFLHVATQGNKPVVLTGAMRPAHAPGADGPANLLAAIALACSPAAQSIGVSVVMNDVVYDAVEVQKIRAEGLDAFSSRNHGPVGRMQGRMFRVNPGREQGNPAWKASFAAAGLKSWPAVHILYAHAGMDAAFVDAALAAKPDGIVVAGVGNGNAPHAVWRRLGQAARQGVAVVRATRTPGGHVDPGVEVDDEQYGFVAAGGLSPQKARILLMLALGQGGDRSLLAAHFASI